MRRWSWCLFLMLSAGLSSGVQASPVVSFESGLQLPIESRVQVFRQNASKGFVFLSKTAFDSGESLTTRWRALTTMGRLNAQAFRKEIDRALKSPEWFMRNAALIALLSDERDRAVEQSMRLLGDPALIVRTQAVRNLIALNANEAEAKLWAEIHNRRNFKGRESLWIRAHLAEALSRLARPGQAKAFQALLLEEDWRLHPWAIRGLEKSTGWKLGAANESTEVRRQQWLARLGVQEL